MDQTKLGPHVPRSLVLVVDDKRDLFCSATVGWLGGRGFLGYFELVLSSTSIFVRGGKEGKQREEGVGGVGFPFSLSEPRALLDGYKAQHSTAQHSTAQHSKLLHMDGLDGRRDWMEGWIAWMGLGRRRGVLCFLFFKRR
ncbi:hypothetical protein VTJ04DRAFT_4959 [Mycothermus thermophilus]|uniref:uncharacterized protein n=1 Tax=Humicola insolens TaxID=85995 RepID=UPI003742155D